MTTEYLFHGHPVSETPMPGCAACAANAAGARPVPAVTLALSGLPDTCPHCDTDAGQITEWLLAPHGNLLQVVCPYCFTAVAPVRAVAATDPDCE